MKKNIFFFARLLPVFVFAQDVALQPYFNRLEPAQPDVKYGGLTVALTVKPDDDNVVVAATERGGLMKSIDHGLTWVTLFGFPGGTWIRDVQFAPNNPNYLIVVTSSNYSSNLNAGGIWLSRNAGVSWEQPLSGIPQRLNNDPTRLMGNCISTYPGSSEVIAGTNMGLAISWDNGISWTFQSVPGTVVNSAALLRYNELLISTPLGIYYWHRANLQWVQERTGIGTAYPATKVSGHNSFYVPSRFANNVYNANPVFVVTAPAEGARPSIQLSINGGQTWNLIDSVPPGSSAAGGTCFIKMAIGASDGLDLYVSNALNIFKKYCPRTGPDFSYNYSANWQGPIENAHSDMADICLDRNGNPWLIAGDGGIQKFWRGNGLRGDKILYDGGGSSSNGFHALQITQVSGMYIKDNPRRLTIDMYYSTQDNHILSSENTGINWTHDDLGGEGVYLEHPREVNDESEAMIGFYHCSPCYNRIGNRNFRNNQPISTQGIVDPETPGQNTNAIVYINKNTYIVSRAIMVPSPLGGGQQITRTAYYLTNNYINAGARPSYSNVINADNVTPIGLLKKTSTPIPSLFVLYQPIQTAAPGGGFNQPVKVMRMVLRNTNNQSRFSGEKTFPACRGLGGIGVYPTEFGVHPVFDVNPFTNDRLIAVDAINGNIVHSENGGDDWWVLPQITNLINENGSKNFRLGTSNITNVSSIAYNPLFPNMILIGTRESGIFYTWNGGYNWSKIPGSEKIPEVSSFYFQNNNTVWVSSYARGLWKLYFSYGRPRRTFQWPDSYTTLIDPLRFPRIRNESGTEENNNMSREYDQALMITDGSIEKIYTDNGVLTSVQYTPNSTAIWYTDEKNFSPSFYVDEAKEDLKISGENMDKITDLAKQGFFISGLLLKGNQLVDVIYGKEPMPFPCEKQYKDYEPIGANELDEKLIPRLTLQSENAMSGYNNVFPGEKMTLYGRRFDEKSTYPVSILLDDKPSDVFGKIELDKYGGFMVTAVVNFPPGYHSITVQQMDAGYNTIGETIEFNVRHNDELNEKTMNTDLPKDPKKIINEKANEIKEKLKNIINNKN